MPSPKVKSWTLKPGTKPFEFFDEDGTSRQLQLGTSFLSPTTAICNQKAKINERMQYESAKREGHDETLHVLIEMSLFARQI